jgi:hypothetical protein
MNDIVYSDRLTKEIRDIVDKINSDYHVDDKLHRLSRIRHALIDKYGKHHVSTDMIRTILYSTKYQCERHIEIRVFSYDNEITLDENVSEYNEKSIFEVLS